MTYPRYLTVKTTAKRLKVTPGTLANWRWRGYGPAYIKIGKRIEYLETDVEAWRLNQRHFPTTSGGPAATPGGKSDKTGQDSHSYPDDHNPFPAAS